MHLQFLQIVCSTNCDQMEIPRLIENIKSFEFLFGSLLILQSVLSGLVFLAGDDWKGDKRGASLNPSNKIIARTVSILLLLCTTTNVILTFYRLFDSPQDINGMDEITLTLGAFGVLYWTDILCIRPRISRRRNIAVYLTIFPTFRFGSKSYGSPTSDAYKNNEFVIRTADYKTLPSAKRNLKEYWRGRVADHFQSPHVRNGDGGSLVLIHDDATQDEAGAGCLSAKFTHVPEFKKNDLAENILKAVYRSGIWNIEYWDSGFCDQVEKALGSERAIRDIINSEPFSTAIAREGLKQMIERAERSEIHNAKTVADLLSGAIAVQTYKYLESSSTPKPSASSLCSLPNYQILKSICELPRNIRPGTWNAGPVIQACKHFKEYLKK